ncbi:MAG: SDR family NAD(P)-dependent oxidoreductase [Chloroflexi bacterium]|nr:MAG: SDR family NAD(P)-dependent oxidoreductase [Chloroflexota bacterium]
MILVIGGSGALGSSVVQRLLQQGRAVRVMTRTSEKVQALQQAGVDVVRGDLTDKASLQRACAGVEKVVASAHSVFGRGQEASKFVDLQGHKDLIDVARAAGVQRFVYISAVGAEPNSSVPFSRIKYQIEQYLRGSSLEFVILRATAFMESHAHMLIGQPIIEKGKVSLFGKGNNPRNFVAAVDRNRWSRKLDEYAGGASL